MKRLLCIIAILGCAFNGNTLFAQDDGASYSVRRQRATTTSRSSDKNNTSDGKGNTDDDTEKGTTSARTTTSRAAFSLSGAQRAAQQSANTSATRQQEGGTTTAVGPRARQEKQEASKEEDNALQLTVRAQTQYNAQRVIPDNPAWKREVYRTLDLASPENAGLADPIMPTEGRMNLFCLIFKLLSDREIQAYSYTLDGNEQFDDEHKADFKDILDRYHVYYRRKRLAATGDTVFVVENSDIPSSEVLSYFIKEVHYYDQINSSFHTDIEAICPVLHRTGDFDLNVVKYPMFWIKMSDLAPYMNQVHIPISEYNNAATVELDDFFAMELYKGEIYKTTNPSGRTLAQYCETDSALAKEQKLIESQLAGVEEALWRNQALSATADGDSTQLASSEKDGKDTKKQSRRQNRRQEVQEEKSSSSSSGASSAPKASVRRQRR